MNYCSKLKVALASACVVCLASVPILRAQATTAPTAADALAAKPTSMELAVRAQQAFNRGEYVTALPLLKKLEADAQGDPIKQAPIQERIRVCQARIGFT